MGTHSDYVATMKAQLLKFDADVDAIAARGATASAETRAAYQGQVKTLRASRDDALKMFEGLRFASESAGTKMHAGMQAAWESMQESLAKVASDLKK